MTNRIDKNLLLKLVLNIYICIFEYLFGGEEKIYVDVENSLLYWPVSTALLGVLLNSQTAKSDFETNAVNFRQMFVCSVICQHLRCQTDLH